MDAGMGTASIMGNGSVIAVSAFVIVTLGAMTLGIVLQRKRRVRATADADVSAQND